jgi:ribosome recycling factor
MKEAIFKELKESMEKSTQAMEKAFNKIRTGRASVSLLDGIKVDYYSTATPLNNVASLSVPDSRMIMIAPWDVSAIGAIEKAIQKSDLGLMPTNDGKLIRLAIPQLTEERRKDLVKQARKAAEEGRVKLRNARREANDKFKALKKDNAVSEDEMFTHQEEVKKLMDRAIDKIDAMLASKEKDIMQI